MLHHMNRASLASRVATTSDPNFENVVMLLHGDGTNGAQNNTFIDGSTNNFTITRNGNTTQGTFSPYGTLWSNFFDGTGDYLVVPGGSWADFGSGNFTIECWFLAPSTNTGYAGILVRHGTDAVRLAFALNSGGTRAEFWINKWGISGPICGSSTTVTDGKWHHLAAVRNGNVFTFYVDGVAGSTTNTWTGSVDNSTNVAWVGSDPGFTTRSINGYVSNLRVLKGTALYTANFTPPTEPLTAITDTQLLTCKNNRFIDNSSNAFSLTRNGDVRVQRFSPFNPSAEYSTSVIGGSAYFDGTGDYLTLASNSAFTFGTGDYTVEAWAYFNSSATDQNVVDLRPLGSLTNQVRIAKNSNLLNLGWGSTDAQISATWVGTGSWVHLVAVRSGTNVAFFVNGTRAGTKTDSTNLDQGTPKIGTWSTTIAYMNGYITGVRIVTGTAIYDPTATTITVPTAPPSAVTNTQLLCNFTNAGIIDNAMMQVPETVGNAQISTSVSKFGTGSLAFDGTGDWLLVPHAPDQFFGTSVFTVELWLYLSATGSARGLVGKGTATTGWLVSTNASNQVVFTFGSSTITSTGTISGTTWTHIAVVREGTGTNQTKIYINGTNDGTGTVSTDFNQTNAMYVGADRTGGSALNGNIDDLRITRGIARYTANFTAPTTPFPNL